MNTINTEDARAVLALVPRDGASMPESEWRRKARGRLPKRSAGYTTRVCNWLIQSYGVALRGEASISRGPNADRVEHGNS